MYSLAGLVMVFHKSETDVLPDVILKRPTLNIQKHSIKY